MSETSSTFVKQTSPIIGAVGSSSATDSQFQQNPLGNFSFKVIGQAPKLLNRITDPDLELRYPSPPLEQQSAEERQASPNELSASNPPQDMVSKRKNRMRLLEALGSEGRNMEDIPTQASPSPIPQVRGAPLRDSVRPSPSSSSFKQGDLEGVMSTLPTQAQAVPRGAPAMSDSASTSGVANSEGLPGEAAITRSVANGATAPSDQIFPSGQRTSPSATEFLPDNKCTGVASAPVARDPYQNPGSPNGDMSIPLSPDRPSVSSSLLRQIPSHSDLCRSLLDPLKQELGAKQAEWDNVYFRAKETQRECAGLISEVTKLLQPLMESAHRMDDVIQEMQGKATFDLANVKRAVSSALQEYDIKVAAHRFAVEAEKAEVEKRHAEALEAVRERLAQEKDEAVQAAIVLERSSSWERQQIYEAREEVARRALEKEREIVRRQGLELRKVEEQRKGEEAARVREEEARRSFEHKREVEGRQELARRKAEEQRRVDEEQTAAEDRRRAEYDAKRAAVEAARNKDADLNAIRMREKLAANLERERQDALQRQNSQPSTPVLHQSPLHSAVAGSPPTPVITRVSGGRDRALSGGVRLSISTAGSGGPLQSTPSPVSASAPRHVTSRPTPLGLHTSSVAAPAEQGSPTARTPGMSGFVPARTEAGKLVSTDMPFSSIALASESKVKENMKPAADANSATAPDPSVLHDSHPNTARPAKTSTAGGHKTRRASAPPIQVKREPSLEYVALSPKLESPSPTLTQTPQLPTPATPAATDSLRSTPHFRPDARVEGKREDLGDASTSGSPPYPAMSRGPAASTESPRSQASSSLESATRVNVPSSASLSEGPEVDLSRRPVQQRSPVDRAVTPPRPLRTSEEDRAVTPPRPIQQHTRRFDGRGGRARRPVGDHYSPPADQSLPRYNHYSPPRSPPSNVARRGLGSEPHSPPDRREYDVGQKRPSLGDTWPEDRSDRRQRQRVETYPLSHQSAQPCPPTFRDEWDYYEQRSAPSSQRGGAFSYEAVSSHYDGIDRDDRHYYQQRTTPPLPPAGPSSYNSVPAPGDGSVRYEDRFGSTYSSRGMANYPYETDRRTEQAVRDLAFESSEEAVYSNDGQMSVPLAAISPPSWAPDAGEHTLGSQMAQSGPSPPKRLPRWVRLHNRSHNTSFAPAKAQSNARNTATNSSVVEQRGEVPALLARITDSHDQVNNDVPTRARGAQRRGNSGRDKSGKGSGRALVDRIE